ncbi:hypothetical protein sos41_03750 [Alphaproteobacteria bacterium SO-S41]|nr:hypothetical protein sos41_03750 [Alphaproteobacteria bacterium SO-S41]
MKSKLVSGGCVLALATGIAAAEAPTTSDAEAWPDRGSGWAEPMPKPMHKGDPGSYPLYAQTFGSEGSATIGFIIDKEGEKKAMLVLASSPSGVFEAACLDYVNSFIYAPQVKDGSLASRKWSYTCRFKLGS